MSEDAISAAENVEHPPDLYDGRILGFSELDAIRRSGDGQLRSSQPFTAILATFLKAMRPRDARYHDRHRRWRTYLH